MHSPLPWFPLAEVLLVWLGQGRQMGAGRYRQMAWAWGWPLALGMGGQGLALARSAGSGTAAGLRDVLPQVKGSPRVQAGLVWGWLARSYLGALAQP